MGHMRLGDTYPQPKDFWVKNRLELIHERVDSADLEKSELHLSSGVVLSYDRLVIASGSKPRRLDIPGEELEAVRSLYHLQDLYRIENSIKGKKQAVVIGGGLIGVELCEMLASRGMKVSFIIREERFWSAGLGPDQSRILEDHMENDHHIELIKSSLVQEIVGDGEGNVLGVRTGDDRIIETDFVGITVGVEPNVDFLRESGLKIRRGILVDRFFRTNLENVYAVGDCAEHIDPHPDRKAIEAVWYSGRMAGETLGVNLAGIRKAYDPGRWFNSAKFFDIEYQEYGRSGPVLQEGEAQLEWTDGDRRNMRIVYREEDHLLLGISTLNIRLRHVVIDKWLRNAFHLAFMVKHLEDVIFQPEFSGDLTRRIQRHINNELGMNWRKKQFLWTRIRSAKDHWR